jgi:hypothetical protein
MTGRSRLFTRDEMGRLLAPRRVAVCARAAAEHGKRVCKVWAPEGLGGPGSVETESDPHLALFHAMDRGFAAKLRTRADG